MSKINSLTVQSQYQVLKKVNFQVKMLLWIDKFAEIPWDLMLILRGMEDRFPSECWVREEVSFFSALRFRRNAALGWLRQTAEMHFDVDTDVQRPRF